MELEVFATNATRELFWFEQCTYVGSDDELHYFKSDCCPDCFTIWPLSVDDVSVTRGLNSCLVEVKQ